MSTKLYIGSLPYSTTDQELSDHFAGAGTVESASVVMDRDTGRSRGFGFVEMPEADAQKAIEMFDGQELGGRTIHVSVARPKEAR